jgi:hypothetical protein
MFWPRWRKHKKTTQFLSEVVLWCFMLTLDNLNKHEKPRKIKQPWFVLSFQGIRSLLASPNLQVGCKLVGLETLMIDTLSCRFVPVIAAATAPAHLRNHLPCQRDPKSMPISAPLPVPRLSQTSWTWSAKVKGLVVSMVCQPQSMMENMLASSCGILSSRDAPFRASGHPSILLFLAIPCRIPWVSIFITSWCQFPSNNNLLSGFQAHTLAVQIWPWDVLSTNNFPIATSSIAFVSSRNTEWLTAFVQHMPLRTLRTN